MGAFRRHRPSRGCSSAESRPPITVGSIPKRNRHRWTGSSPVARSRSRLRPSCIKHSSGPKIGPSPKLRPSASTARSSKSTPPSLVAKSSACSIKPTTGSPECHSVAISPHKCCTVQPQRGRRPDRLMHPRTSARCHHGRSRVRQNRATRAAASALDASRYTLIYLGNPAVGASGLYAAIVTALGGVPRFHKANLIPQTADLHAAEPSSTGGEPSTASTCVAKLRPCRFGGTPATRRVQSTATT